MRLKDRVAIVTGGGKGIGKAIALAFAAEGAAVVISGRSAPRLEATAGEIRARNGRATAIPTDVSNEAQVKEMVARTIAEYGKVDILVNNSGITGPTAPVAEMDLAGWNETLAVNLTGAMLCSREVLRHMIPRKSGAIVMITSEGGRGCDGKSGFPKRSPYTCAKIGMIGLTETMSVEVGEYGIRVNAVSPSGVMGERIRGIFTGRAQAMGTTFQELIDKVATANYSLRRFAEEREIASAALFLASDEASAITGQTLVVNCGHHIVH